MDEDQALPNGVPDQYLTPFMIRMLLVFENPRERIGERGKRLFERNAMPGEIRSRFLQVPFEVQRHCLR